MSDMWYPNVSVKVWLRLHPSLKEHLPLECGLCGVSTDTPDPYKNRITSGFTIRKCNNCGGKDTINVGIVHSKEFFVSICRLEGILGND